MPPFTPDGVLPVGDYALTIGQLRQSHLVTGSQNASPAWDSAWRGQLVDNLAVMAAQLWAVGITDIFVDGSFVENKPHPGDIDGYFIADLMRVATGQLQDDLNRFEPNTIWTWDSIQRSIAPGSSKAQLPMWHKYRVELFPHIAGFPSGIRDQFGNDLEFPAAFRVSRQFIPKGIIVLKQGA